MRQTIKETIIYIFKKNFKDVYRFPLMNYILQKYAEEQENKKPFALRLKSHFYFI